MPCWFQVLNNYSLFFSIPICGIIRIWAILFDFKIAEERRSQTNGFYTRHYKFARPKTLIIASILLFLLSSLPAFIELGNNEALLDEDGWICSSIAHDKHIVFFCSFVGIFVALLLFATVFFYFTLKNQSDGFYIKKELSLLSCITLIGIIIWSILFFSPPVYDANLRSFPIISIWTTFVFFFLCFVTLHFPINRLSIIRHHSQGKVPYIHKSLTMQFGGALTEVPPALPSPFEYVMCHEVISKAFLLYLESEWCSENLRFLCAVDEARKMFSAVNERKNRDSSVIVSSALASFAAKNVSESTSPSSPSTAISEDMLLEKTPVIDRYLSINTGPTVVESGIIAPVDNLPNLLKIDALDKDSQNHQIAHRIIEVYVMDGAPLQVNLSFDIVMLLESDIDGLDEKSDVDFGIEVSNRDIFAPAYNHMYSLLREGPYTRFVLTKEYAIAMAKLAKEKS